MNTIGTKGLIEALGLSKGAADRLVSRPDFPAPVAAESNGGRPEKRWRIAELPVALTIKGRAVAVREPAQQWALQQAFAALVAATPSVPTTDSPPPVSSAGALPVASSTAAGLSHSLPPALLTDDQRIERDARAGVLDAIRRFRAEAGCSQERAMHALLALAASGRADPLVVRSLQLARDKRGRKGNGLPAIRTLKRWLAAADLTPKTPQRDMSVPPWAKVFLERYQQPQKPSVETAYRESCHAWAADERPSIHQVRRFLAKLGAVTRERGRMGERELKTIRPYITRSFDHLEPNDIWSADGHTFDAEVQHPFHGRPFRPEITTIVDIATRRIVGWSIDLAESGMAVLDALRHAAECAGLAAIFYVDRGSGYDNALLKDEGAGLAGRMGFEVKHSIAYNSQARGVIERLHKTVWVEGAKLLPSYVGAAMDREARLAHFKLTRKALKAGARGAVMPLLPWDVFLSFCRERVAAYNARAHRSLKGVSPDLKWREFEAKGWQPHTLAAADLDALFRPRVERTIARGRVSLFTNYYASNALEEFHGDRVQVAYDLHQVDKVWLYTPEGRYIGEAQINGNTRHYYPVAVVEQAREKRARAREKRIRDKLAAVREELRGPALDAPPENSIVLGARIVTQEVAQAEGRALLERDAQPVEARRPLRRSERSVAENMAEWDALDARIRAGEAVGEDEAYWHESFQRHPSWRAEMKRREAHGRGGDDAERRRAAG